MGTQPEHVLNGFRLRSQGVRSEYDFFYAVSLFATRPHLLNRAIKGATLPIHDHESHGNQGDDHSDCGNHEENLGHGDHGESGQEEPNPKYFYNASPENDAMELENDDANVGVVPRDVSDSLTQPFSKATIDELRDLRVHEVLIKRTLLGNSLKEYNSTEHWGKLNESL